ncbi:hypothetical protein B0H19DRAFT_1142160 [Mycena capillaripes]|nr:hypothetical protein B0H19DRAFT_1142160 [Mycena capillaripes]
MLSCGLRLFILLHPKHGRAAHHGRREPPPPADPGRPRARHHSRRGKPFDPIHLRYISQVYNPMGYFLRNMAKEQADQLKANPWAFLAVIPNGAREKFYESNLHANRETMAFIQSLGTCTSTH